MDTKKIIDKTGKGNELNFAETNRMFETPTDAHGTYIQQSGVLAHGGNFNAGYGKLQLKDNNGISFGNQLAGKRYIYSVSVLRPQQDIHLSTRRAFMRPNNINLSTGQLYSINHGLSTGNIVTTHTLNNVSMFPTPTVAFAPTLYARKINTHNFSLHPTQTDAENNTNTYVYSDSGVGRFYVANPADTSVESMSRQFLFDLNMGPNDHSFSPIIQTYRKKLPMDRQVYFPASSSINGEIDFFAKPTDVGSNWDVLKFRIYIPPASIGVTCLDTNLPLETGTYYMTKSPNSTRVRLHRTEGQAQAAAGIVTSALDNTQVLKYGALGLGEVTFYLEGHGEWRPFDDGFNNEENLVEMNQFGVYAMMVDYDDGSGKRSFYSGKDELWNLINNKQSAKNSPLPAPSNNSNIILNNAGEPHVPGKYDHYETVIGASDSDPTQAITDILDHFKTKYSIT